MTTLLDACFLGLAGLGVVLTWISHRRRELTFWRFLLIASLPLLCGFAIWWGGHFHDLEGPHFQSGYFQKLYAMARHRWPVDTARILGAHILMYVLGLFMFLGLLLIQEMADLRALTSLYFALNGACMFCMCSFADRAIKGYLL